MPQFIKEIVRAGKYHIPDGVGGTREVSITPKRLEKWVSTFNKQMANGLRVPAPGSHDFEKAIPVRLGPSGTLESSVDNLGFWDALWVDPDTQTLKGIVNAPGSVDDPNTPAGKLGKTVQETSVYINPKWKDGAGNDYDEAVMHIACVTHPIQPGQSNFQPADDGIAIAMSFRDNTSSPDPSQPTDPSKVLGSEDPEGAPAAASNASISEVITLLRDVAKIALPQDTTDTNLVERLLIALNQKSLEDDEEGEGSVNEPPEGAQLRNAPFVMAFNPKQIEALVKTVNPETGKPFTAADFQAPPAEDVVMSHPKVKQLEQSTNVLLSVVTDQAKANLRSRVTNLVASGRTSKAHVDAAIMPMVDSLVMSFAADGKPVKQPVEMVLEALEAIQPMTPASNTNDYGAFLAMSHGVPPGATVQNGLPHPENNNAGEQQASPEQTEAVFARLKKAGLLAS